MYAILLVASPIGFAFGVLMVMAGAMSDAPAAGDATAKQGFILSLACICMFIFAFVAKHNHWIG